MKRFSGAIAGNGAFEASVKVKGTAKGEVAG